MTELDKYKKVYRKYFYVENTNYIDVIFGVIFANRLDAEPVWLYLIGPPSIGKTQIVQPLSASSEIYPISRLRQNVLISGLKIKNKDPSLLPKLNNKVLIIKDFTAMLTMKHDALLEVLGQLRDAYDGSASVPFGTGETQSYKSKFGLIACVTGAIDKHLGLLAELGERFVTYRLPEISKFEEAKRCMKAMSIESVHKKDEELREAASKVLQRQIKPASISEYDKLRILKICQVVALARCSIQRNRYTQEPELPSPEAAVRLSEQLSNLAVGVAMAREKKRVTKDEISLIREIAVYSITAKRLILINALLQYYPDYVSIERIIESMSFRFSEIIVRRWLEEMQLLDLADSKATVNPEGYIYYRWQLKDGRLLKEILLKNKNK